jgi:hypothetical protein
MQRKYSGQRDSRIEKRIVRNLFDVTMIISTFALSIIKLLFMPTIFFYLGMRFHFYSNDHLPIHVHVSVDNSEARFQVCPDIKLIENRGLKLREIRWAEVAIEENREIIIARWKEHFKGKFDGNDVQNLV